MPASVMFHRTVLFGDCDPAGVVYTPRFSDFALEATHGAFDVWLGKPGLTNLMGFGILSPVRTLCLEFLHPLSWDDELNLQVTLAHLGKHSFSCRVEGKIDPDIKVFTANITYVCVCAQSKNVVEIPQKLRHILHKKIPINGIKNGKPITR